MRLWSIHPGYLDPRGLVALWREGLLALAVLRGLTKGYRRHPQLDRFRQAADPVETMKCYLGHVHLEAVRRGYRFDAEKIGAWAECRPLEVTAGQLRYELEHLKRKLKTRSPRHYRAIEKVRRPRPHPLFETVPGPVADWERPG